MFAGFIGKIYKDIKRGIIILILILLSGSVVYTIILYGVKKSKKSFSAIVDVDSGNGMEKIIALSRILADPEFNLIGLTASQWNPNSFGFERSVIISDEQNENLLKAFNRTEISHYRGGGPVISNPPQPVSYDSEASRFIVSKAREASHKKKLNIIVLGALTNIAAAVKLDSTIIPRIRIYALAMKYTPSSKVWNKNESNARSDLDALDFLLDADDLEMHIMPLSVAVNLSLDKSEVQKAARGKESWNYLLQEWSVRQPGSGELPVPSLALIGAIINPDFARVEQAVTPPENKRKMVFVYTWINKEFMTIDYLGTIQKSNRKPGKQNT